LGAPAIGLQRSCFGVYLGEAEFHQVEHINDAIEQAMPRDWNIMNLILVHQPQNRLHGLIKFARPHPARHQFAHRFVDHVPAEFLETARDVPLGDDAKDCLIVVCDDEGGSLSISSLSMTSPMVTFEEIIGTNRLFSLSNASTVMLRLEIDLAALTWLRPDSERTGENLGGLTCAIRASPDLNWRSPGKIQFRFSRLFSCTLARSVLCFSKTTCDHIAAVDEDLPLPFAVVIRHDTSLKMASILLVIAWMLSRSV
jgi:hypothetical protein